MISSSASARVAVHQVLRDAPGFSHGEVSRCLRSRQSIWCSPQGWDTPGFSHGEEVTLGLCGVIGWQLWHPPQMGYAKALGALDTTLRAQWQALPKPAQDALSATYGRIGLTPPGQRK